MPAIENLDQPLRVSINGNERDVRAGTSLADLLRDLGIGSEGTAAAVNDRVVARAEHARYTLSAGDRIEVLHAVAGG